MEHTVQLTAGCSATRELGVQISVLDTNPQLAYKSNSCSLLFILLPYSKSSFPLSFSFFGLSLLSSPFLPAYSASLFSIPPQLPQFLLLLNIHFFVSRCSSPIVRCSSAFHLLKFPFLFSFNLICYFITKG